MLRRNPTRIELKLDDISEYTEMRDAELKKEKLANQGNSSSCSLPTKNRQDIIHDRIGYAPHPRPSA